MRSCFALLTFILIIGPTLNLVGQNREIKKDTISMLGGSSQAIDSLNSDPNKVIEDAALDIGQNRGLFILTPDGKMQMRILGSVRYLVGYDEFALPTKSSFYTIEIPTGNEKAGPPNYYNALTQSRLGFEVTRHTSKGNVFVRLETDFSGPNGFRIRHAYGQYQKFVLGQTWSLFAQVTSAPSTVDFSGPTGVNIARTPQVRYTAPNLIPKAKIAFALEYFKPQVTDLDSLGSNVFQLIPDVSVRIDRQFEWGAIQLSGILPTLTAELSDGNYVSQNGYGLSVSGIFKIKDIGKIYIQATGGKGIARYIGDLSRRQLDLIIDPEFNIYMPFCLGSFVTYEHNWSKKMFSNLSYGLVVLEQFSFYPTDSYKLGQSVHLNNFWNIVEGAKLGVEYIFGYTINNDGSFGSAQRINAMIYYDF